MATKGSPFGVDFGAFALLLIAIGFVAAIVGPTLHMFCMGAQARLSL